MEPFSFIEVFRSAIDQENYESPSLPGNYLKGIYRVVEEGYLEVDVPVRPELCNPRGTIHGGMVSLIADEYIGVAILTKHPDFAYTSVNLNVDFLRPAVVGDVLRVKVRVLKPGRKISNVEVDITNKETGKMVARAMSNMLNTGIALMSSFPKA